MSFNILNIGEHVLIDNSIVNCEYHSYPPYANTTLNNSDEIRIPIQTQEIYTLPTNSFLYFEGRLLDNTKKFSATLSFVNNFMAYLFDEIRYELTGVVVDRTLKKILINVRQELVLIRSSTDMNAIVTTNVHEKAHVELYKVMWRMPHVQVADIEKLRLLKYIENGRDLEIAFRSWELHEYPVLQQTTRHTWNVKATNQLEKPRFVILALQTDRKGINTKNSSHFDHCDLRSVKLYLNSDTYPYDNLIFDFVKNHTSILYEMYAQFQQAYYYKNCSEPSLTYKDFLLKAPLFVIDCSRQNESLKSGSVDIRLEFETDKNVPENTTAFCLILHDRLVKYNALSNTVKIV
ncbi:hypothetical protein NQ315_012267 [Exocentrus adspersus]|uniref:Double jelly roll-like domain-containing protein n=1 Tax=Exocentrus adspersus TaxID=1586481 RepID=A0AAV8VEZ1_9CUCU|nr:hypothetical protein NQ315_012267 [Exocentrus adspersus]